MLWIRGQALMFRRGVGPKNYKCSLRRMDMKSIMIIYLRKVSDIGRKQIYKDEIVLRMVKW